VGQYRDPVAALGATERVTNAAMGTEIDKFNKYESVLDLRAMACSDNPRDDRGTSDAQV
jgi:glyoxylate carboligase